MRTAYIWFLLQGAWHTILLSVLSLVLGGVLGFLVSLVRISKVRAVSALALVYIEAVQGIPPLVLMALAFYGPAILGGVHVSALGAATLALAIFSSAYLGEIWRGCLQAVPKAQWEAAECLGLTATQRLFRVILPQALRLSLPPTVGFVVQLVKSTSIASVAIGYGELTYNAKILNNSTFEPFMFFGLAGVLYFVMCYPLSRASRRLEARLNLANR